MGGFQLLDLHDFPGQGTALVGVLDPFWDSKGYVTAEEYRRFCDTTVPLARLTKRVFTTDETLEADIEVAHFGPTPLAGAWPSWKLVGDDGQSRGHGARCRRATSRSTTASRSGRVQRAARAKLAAPAQVPARSSGLEGTPFENDWDIWVYPPRVGHGRAGGRRGRERAGRRRRWRALRAGGKVLLLDPARPRAGDAARARSRSGFSSIFWNTAWTRRQAPHTLGILCDPEAPRAGRVPHRVPQQLAVVVPRQPAPGR